MPGEDRNEAGRYTTSYSDEAFLTAVRNLGPAVGTQAIADEVGVIGILPIGGFDRWKNRKK